MESQRRLETGAQYDIDVPDPAGSITLRAVAVWSFLLTSTGDGGDLSPHFRVGLYFIGMESSTISQLVRFMSGKIGRETVEQTMHTMSGLRGNTRYSLADGVVARAAVSETFAVLTLTTGAIIIGNDLPLDSRQRYDLEVFLADGSALSLQGTVIDQKEDGSGGRRYTAAVQLVDVSEEQAALLRVAFKGL